MTRSQTFVDGLHFPKGPRWHNGALYCSDNYRGEIHRCTADNTTEIVARVPGAAGLGWLSDDSMIVASSTDTLIYRVAADGSIRVHADLRGIAPGKLNDLITDSRGFAYVGNYGFDYDARVARRPHSFLYEPPGVPATPLFLVSPDGAVTVASEDLIYPNGAVFLDGGRTLLVAETLAFRISAFDVRPDGRLTNRRIWATLVDPGLWKAINSAGPFGAIVRRIAALLEHPAAARWSRSPIAPDDIAAGANGTVWVANSVRGECVRIEEGGRVIERRQTRGARALGCAIGDGSLFIATVATIDPAKAARYPMTRIEKASIAG